MIGFLNILGQWDVRFHEAIADFTGLPYVYGFLSGLKSHGLISHDYHDSSSHVLEASIKIEKEILFCKQTGLYILHAK